MSNIPWDATYNDIVQWLKPHCAVEFGIHLLMDRTTEPGATSVGKTLSDAYVEFKDTRSWTLLVHLRGASKTYLKGRQVIVRESSHEELFRRIFPNHSSDTDESRRMYLSRDEINTILLVCKHYKLHYSRKCADRPFECVISIVSKIPWLDAEMCPTLMQRDHVFEMLKISIETLRGHLNKDYRHVSPQLLVRLARVGVSCTGFTERQKNVLLVAAGIECPSDLVDKLIEPPVNYISENVPHFDDNVRRADEHDEGIPLGLNEMERKLKQMKSSSSVLSAHHSWYNSNQRARRQQSPVRRPNLSAGALSVSSTASTYEDLMAELRHAQENIDVIYRQLAAMDLNGGR